MDNNYAIYSYKFFEYKEESDLSAHGDSPPVHF